MSATCSPSDISVRQFGEVRLDTEKGRMSAVPAACVGISTSEGCLAGARSFRGGAISVSAGVIGTVAEATATRLAYAAV